MYTKIRLLLCILYHFSTADAFIGTQIKQAERGEFPFIVSIGYVHTNNAENNHICGGAVISKRHVLTSEHCIFEERARNLKVLVGTNDLQSAREYSVASIMRFDDWSKRHRSASYPNNDVAILTLEEVVNDVTPGVIDEKSRNVDFYGKSVVTAGWGEDEDGNLSRHLQKITLNVLTPEQSSESLYKLTRKRYQINERYFCTTATPYVLLGKGDEGSPLLYNNRIIGVNDGTYPLYMGDNPGELNLHIGIEFYRRFIRDILISD